MGSLSRNEMENFFLFIRSTGVGSAPIGALYLGYLALNSAYLFIGRRGIGFSADDPCAHIHP